MTETTTTATNPEDKAYSFLRRTGAPFAEHDAPTTVIHAVAGDPRYASVGDRAIAVPTSFIQYGLRPTHQGSKVFFLDASDNAFYHQQLSEPSVTVWCLGNSDSTEGYVKRRLFESAFSKNIQMNFMATSHFELFATKDGLDTVYYDGNPVELPDIILVRVGALVDYFGLAVIRQLERMGVTVLNGSTSIEISRDKLQTMQFLAAHGLPIPKTLLARFPFNIETLEKELSYPVILKKSSGSQGKGIIKVSSSEQLEELVDLLDTKDPLIFQEFIKASSGRDLRVYVVGGRVVASMMRIAAKGYKANVHQGGLVEAVEISPQVEWLVLEVVRIIGLDCAGVDLLIDEDTFKICEVNSSPGFKGLETATGSDVAASIVQYIKLRLGVWRTPKRFKEIKKGVAVSTKDD